MPDTVVPTTINQQQPEETPSVPPSAAAAAVTAPRKRFVGRKTADAQRGKDTAAAGSAAANVGDVENTTTSLQGKRHLYYTAAATTTNFIYLSIHPITPPSKPIDFF